jgi:hypothetical protein
MVIINGFLIADVFLMTMILYALNILINHNKSKAMISNINFLEGYVRLAGLICNILIS